MNDVLDYWFGTLSPSDWYEKSNALDQHIREHFEPTFKKVIAGETAHWRDNPKGRLAEIIVLDQFTRNMYRGTPAAFGADPLALALAQEAVRCCDDEMLEGSERAFLYMPYMHSESRVVHEQALILFSGLPNLGFEIKHKSIIDRFGRYPHRNKILGRLSTPEEIEWLASNDGF